MKGMGVLKRRVVVAAAATAVYQSSKQRAASTAMSSAVRAKESARATSEIDPAYLAPRFGVREQGNRDALTGAVCGA
jgi:hypothetical protein